MGANRLGNKLARLEGRRDQLLDIKKKLTSEQKELEEVVADHEQALMIAQFIANKTQQDLEHKVSNIVTTALEAVYDNTYKFILKFDIKYGKTDAAIYLERDGNQVSPMDASGGGIVDLCSFALRLACWSMSPIRKTGLFVLDEPFKFVDKVLQLRLADLLSELARRLDIQILMITHEYTLYTCLEESVCLGDKAWLKEFAKS